MEGLLILLAIAYLLAPVVAFFLALSARSRIGELALRLAAVERRLAPAPTPPADETAAPAPPPEVAAAAPQPSPEPPPAAAPQPDATRPGFEERFGTRWVVWVGGLALALGGIFLVRYSIEQGLIGPGVRIFLGALLAAALIAAGEWTRRREALSGIAGLPAAHIPSILTAAGTTVAYATAYAAYALYGFLGPLATFLLLGAVALVTLAASLLHGPALAALGLVGAELAPLLVSTDKPDYWALYIYLAVVTAAALALARLRLWRWLAVTAVAFGVLWMLPGLADAGSPVAAHAFHAVVGFVLVAVFVVSGLLLGPQTAGARPEVLSSGALAAYLLGATLLVLARHHDGVALAVFACLVAATLGIAWRSEAATAAVPAAALLTLAVMANWSLDLKVETLVLPGGATAGLPPEPAASNYGPHLLFGGALAALFGGAGFLAQGRSPAPLNPILWAASGVFAPVAVLIALHYRIAGFERSIPFAAIALLLAALYAVATETLTKRPPRPGSAAAGALFAVGAIAGLALALTFALEKGWLTIALALMVPGIAWVADYRAAPFLRWLAAAMVALVLVRVGSEPRIVGADIGTTPVFNWLLYGYGVPALSFWLAGHLLRRHGDDVPTRAVEAAAILFTVLVVFLEIRHYAAGGDIYRDSRGVTEVGLQVSAGLALAIGLEWLRGRSGSIVHDVGALVVAALTLLGIAFDLVIVIGPRFHNAPVDGLFFNLILLNYGLPAVLCIALALIARTTRPLPYRFVAAAAAVTLALFYLTLQVKRVFHGPLLWEGAVTDAEQYTFSAVWLVFGILLLAVGVFLRSQPARLAAAAVIILTIGKVFAIDTANLTGIWRALSLIGLGIPLVGIGYLYQRLLYPRRAPADPAASAAG
jgi:uncharacterized membrane protein